MSPLKIEILDPATKEPRSFGMLYPGDIPGSFPDYPPKGPLQVVLFECEADDRSSVIYRSQEGAYGSIKNLHVPGVEEIARVPIGQIFDLRLRTGEKRQEVTVRFTQIEKR